MKNKKAFTLIEIVIVIAIIGVIMGATMKFGGDRIGFLNNKNIKEQVIGVYDDLQLSALSTNYYRGNIYDSINVVFSSNSGFVSYYYSGHQQDNKNFKISVKDGSYEVVKILSDGTEFDYINVQFIPYQLSCHIGDEDISKLDFELIINNSKKYCFHLEEDNCRLSEYVCY